MLINNRLSQKDIKRKIRGRPFAFFFRLRHHHHLPQQQQMNPFKDLTCLLILSESDVMGDGLPRAVAMA